MRIKGKIRDPSSQLHEFEFEGTLGDLEKFPNHVGNLKQALLKLVEIKE
ncbi:MAG: hypothetical protein KAQ83_00515 [Nanoarchaeota archaeon]|nr:hypothetical protein [Nanoarchaeota archaeon]